jgi:hypothetical protein
MDGRFDCCRYEPSLDDLLADEMMVSVLKSAGYNAGEFREMMAETARRVDRHDPWRVGPAVRRVTPRGD